MHDSILKLVSETRGFHAFFIFDNPYFIGPDSSSSQRLVLSESTQAKVIELVTEDIASGVGVSSQDFQEKYCRPLRLGEVWLNRQKAHFGKCVTDSPAFQRVANMLLSSQGRVRILACIRGSCPLEGRSDQDVGASEHCGRSVWFVRSSSQVT